MNNSNKTVLVVEGATDIAFLSSFIDCEYVSTNGSDVPRETINYLKYLEKTHRIIVLTDPDYPGKQIRDLINREIPSSLNVFAEKEFCIKNGKVGIAQSNKEYIMSILNNVIGNGTINRKQISMTDLFELGLIGCPNSKEKRTVISVYYHLGFTNAKTFLNRLNSIGVSLKELRGIVNE